VQGSYWGPANEYGILEMILKCWKRICTGMIDMVSPFLASLSLEQQNSSSGTFSHLCSSWGLLRLSQQCRATASLHLWISTC
jgi:hypothetical protein